MSTGWTSALRVAAGLWLHEVRPDDLTRLRQAPRLGDALARSLDAFGGDVDRLAAEHQRLLGFAVPPFESLFVDPSAMMMAPATARVAALYREAGWTEPTDTRAAAPDHLGVELLALADLVEAGKVDLARRLHHDHLALWAPAWIEALGRTRPAALYESLAALTLELLLDPLDTDTAAPTMEQASFPHLPPAPRYRGTGMAIPADGESFSVGVGGILEGDEAAERRRDERDRRDPSDRSVAARTNADGSSDAGENGRDSRPSGERADDDADLRLRDLARRLLVPRETGLWLGRADVLRLSGSLDLPSVVGDRAAMLEGLLRSAGQHGAAHAAFDGLHARFDDADATYAAWAERWPAWTPQSAAWRSRVARTRERVATWRDAVHAAVHAAE